MAADTKRNRDVRDAARGDAALLPFEAEPDDHCESPPEAYEDLAATLDVVAAALGRGRSNLRIYDPYYCSGRRRAAPAGPGLRAGTQRARALL